MVMIKILMIMAVMIIRMILLLLKMIMIIWRIRKKTIKKIIVIIEISMIIINCNSNKKAVEAIIFLTTITIKTSKHHIRSKQNTSSTPTESDKRINETPASNHPPPPLRRWDPKDPNGGRNEQGKPTQKRGRGFWYLIETPKRLFKRKHQEAKM